MPSAVEKLEQLAALHRECQRKEEEERQRELELEEALHAEMEREEEERLKAERVEAERIAEELRMQEEVRKAEEEAWKRRRLLKLRPCLRRLGKQIDEGRRQLGRHRRLQKEVGQSK